MGQIDIQDDHGRPPHRGTAQQEGAVPAEMTPPPVSARVEEPSPLTSLWINTRKVGAFVMIAGKTRESKVGRNRVPAVLFPDDVIDFEGG
jgi:hypothetical protein